MEKFKDPGLILAGADAIAIVGGGMWLYQLHSKMNERMDNVEGYISSMAHGRNPIYGVINQNSQATLGLKTRVDEIQEHLMATHKETKYILKCLESIAEKLSTPTEPFELPSKRREKKKTKKRGKKRRKTRNTKHKRKNESSSDESSSDSSSSSESSGDSEYELNDDELKKYLNRNKRNR